VVKSKVLATASAPADLVVTIFANIPLTPP
jgi:hypothetical protein